MNQLRTSHSNNCQRKANDLYNFFSSYPECLKSYDRTFIEKYNQIIQGLINDGTYDTIGQLNDEPWNVFNIRYDLKSIKGTNAEIQACVLQNRVQTNGTVFCLDPSDEEGQKRGKDIKITNKRWKNPYVGQVKGLYMNRMDTEFTFYKDWFKDSYVGTVDRLLLVDIEKHILVEVDFNEVMKHLGTFGDDVIYKKI